MSRQVASDIDAMTASTQSLQRSIAGLRDDQVGEPSLLPGWTRGHVLTHVARNADAFVNVLTWARTGVETPMYPGGREGRNADIEAGSVRSAAAIVADVEESHQRLMTALDHLDDEHWAATVRYGGANRETQASELPGHRRTEVEIHHVDLDLDYTLAHLPLDFVEKMLSQVARELSAREGLPGFVLVGNDNEGRWTVGAGGPEITGTPPSLVGWLLGRTDGIGVFSADPLPVLGPWR